MLHCTCTFISLHRVFITELSSLSPINRRRSARILAKRLSSSNETEEPLKVSQKLQEGVSSSSSSSAQQSCSNSTGLLTQEESTATPSKRTKSSSSSSHPKHRARKGSSSNRVKGESKEEAGRKKRIKLSSPEVKAIVTPPPLKEEKGVKTRHSSKRSVGEVDQQQSESDQDITVTEERGKSQKRRRKDSYKSSKPTKGKQQKSAEERCVYVCCKHNSFKDYVLAINQFILHIRVYTMCVFITV